MIGRALQDRVHVVLKRFMAQVGADIHEVHAIHRPWQKRPLWRARTATQVQEDVKTRMQIRHGELRIKTRCRKR
ncbi:hypothetical protein GCM10009126_09190 [Rhodanobacter caeni]|uniref:Uncharacterized protein n=1 Tax=Rhodanobacter caeni TaxID=657654 RepID=A0ABN0UCD1_9GAMM